jgi:uncharacterized protein (TIGR03083 family)
MNHLTEILVVDRFEPLRAHLLELLSGLDEDDWSRATAAPRWSVKDVTAHLLGGDIGILSRVRDEYSQPSARLTDYGDLVRLVDRLNDEWIVAARRISPRVLQELLAFTGPRVESYFASLDLHAIDGPVSWAGLDAAPVWFDVAREFTERWHHQQQIRDATGRQPLDDPYFFAPVLDTFSRALPFSFRHAVAPSGTSVRFQISGDAGGVWFLQHGAQGWDFVATPASDPAANVVLPQEIAWRLFTKGIDRDRARTQAIVRGQEDLVSPIFGATAIIG